MFEKKEDKLFEYAFGDLDAHDAQVFEAGLLKDEISAEEVKFLQSIKGDLASFRDIPEMQYSKERLRNAILGQGLKPTRPGLPWLNWVLAPGAAACVFALGYVLMNGTSRKDPSLIGAPTVASKSGSSLKLPVQELKKPEPVVATNSGSDNSFPDVSDTHYAYDSVQSNSGSRTKPHVEIVRSKVHKHGTSSHSSATMVAMNAVKTIEAGPTMGVVSFESTKALTKTAAAKEPVQDINAAPSLDATLILIDKDQDSGVGAPVATEVNDTRNVIIGG